jgi:hypothetical protein
MLNVGLQLMEEEMARARETIFKGRWVEVRITAPTYGLAYMCTGFVYCLQGRRLLDQLNEVFPSALPEKKDFLSVRDVKMYSLRGAEEAVEFACLNRANILFVQEFDGQTRGLGAEPGYKHYPYVPKSPIAVKLLLPFYILSGHVHCAKGERVSDVLNSELRFLPLTNVEISSSVGRSEPGVSFVAVNKGQIILLEEGEDTAAGK